MASLFSASHSYGVSSELKSRLCYVLSSLHVSTGDVCLRTVLHNRRLTIDKLSRKCKGHIISYIYHVGILVAKTICVRRRINFSILNISTVSVFILSQDGFRNVGFA
jgi:hypothetical protein